MQTDENIDKPKTNEVVGTAKKIFWGSVTLLTLVLAIIATRYTVSGVENSKGPKNVIATFKKYIKHDGNLVTGKINNQDDIHAEKLNLVCKYNGKIKNIITYDPKVKKSSEDGMINVDVERLVAGKTCKVDFFGEKDFEIKDNIELSWGGGRTISVAVGLPTPEEVDLMQSIDKAGMTTNKSIEAYQKNNQLTVAR